MGIILLILIIFISTAQGNKKKKKINDAYSELCEIYGLDPATKQPIQKKDNK